MSAAFTYFIALVVALISCVLLLFKSRNGDVTRRGAIAAGVIALWGLLLGSQALRGDGLGWIVLLAEAGRCAALLLVLRALQPDARTPWPNRLELVLTGLLALYAVTGWLGNSLHSFQLPLRSVLDIAGLILSFIGLVLTEQVIRGSSLAQSVSVKLCAIGLGGQFAYDLFLYSQAQLLGGLDGGAWALRGLTTAALMVPFTLGAWRMPPTTPRVFVSRHIVVYSSAFFIVGLYLCFMAVGGYYVRREGGEWGNALQILFLCGAVGVLVLLLLDGSPLRRLRVFIATHFYRNKYDYRIEWLRFVSTLSTNEESDIRRTAVRAVAQILGSPGGLLMARTDDDAHFVLQAAWPEPLSSSIDCATVSAGADLPLFLERRQWVVDLREHRDHPERYGALNLPSWLSAQCPWRVIAPLLIGNKLLGFLILKAPPEPFSMTFEDRDLLKTVGRNVAVQLAERAADAKLAESRQFDAFNKLVAFVMHDLKNSVAQLQLVVANADRHLNNPVFIEDAIGTIRNASDRMTRLIEQLQSRELHGVTRPVNLGAIARAAVGRAATRQPAAELTGETPEIFVSADPDRLASIIDHVIRNAQEATAPDGRVSVKIGGDGGEACLHVVDSGMGMDDEFLRQRLFRPFESTKGSKGMGIGAYQVREYVRSVGGDVEVHSTPGAGTDFCIRLIQCQKANQDS